MVHKAGPIQRSILLFSGGMDSVCLEFLMRPNILLHTAMPGASDAEWQAVVILAEKHLPGRRIVQALPYDLTSWRRPDGVVPNRNSALILLASQYADTIIIGSVNGDQAGDNGPQFNRLMEDLLNFNWAPSKWCAGRKFHVLSPVTHLTKRQLVRDYLKLGGSKDALLASYSCYAGGWQHCGVCAPCRRRRVAFDLNGVTGPDNCEMKQNYWDAPGFAEFLSEINERARNGDMEALDFREHLGLEDVLPEPVKP